jgi:DNA-binding transcriptional regulator YiaG
LLTDLFGFRICHLILKLRFLPIASVSQNRHHEPSDGQQAAPPSNHKTQSLAHCPGIQSSQTTIRALVAGGLPIKLGTLQQWERARSSPQVVTAAVLERFLLEHHEMPLPQKAPAPVVLRLKAWREAKHLSQAEAVAALVSAGVPAKLQTLQQWEKKAFPPAITAAALERFLQEYPGTDQHSAGR